MNFTRLTNCDGTIFCVNPIQITSLYPITEVRKDGAKTEVYLVDQTSYHVKEDMGTILRIIPEVPK